MGYFQTYKNLKSNHLWQHPPEFLAEKTRKWWIVVRTGTEEHGPAGHSQDLPQYLLNSPITTPWITQRSAGMMIGAMSAFAG